MNKKNRKITIGIFLLLALSAFAWYYSARGERSFLEHLENKTLKIESFEITYKQRKVECSNKKVCSSLSNMFITQDGKSTCDCTLLSYKIKMKFNNRQEFICPMYIGREGFSLSVSKYDIYGEEHPTHCYNLTEAIPELKAILNFLNLSIEDGRGKVLIVNDSENKVVFDKSLLSP